jgi:peptidyl-prolyl cis-trans isomerase C
MADNLAKNGAVVAASVGGIQITQADVADAMRAMPVSMANLGFQPLYRHVLDELMNQKLAVLAARAGGLDKDPDVIRRQRDAADHVLADAWVSQKETAAVTDDALHALYDREVAGKPGPAEVRARVILVPTEAEAESLIAKLQAGEQFDDLAHRYSKDWTAVAGGDMGWLPLDSLSPQVGAATFAMAPGQFTQFPVRAQPGYFVIRVEGRRQRATPTFEEARGMLTHQLRREAGGKAVQALISNVKVNAPAGQGGATP